MVANYLEKMDDKIAKLKELSENSIISPEMAKVNRGNVVWYIQASQTKRIEKEIKTILDQS